VFECYLVLAFTRACFTSSCLLNTSSLSTLGLIVQTLGAIAALLKYPSTVLQQTLLAVKGQRRVFLSFDGAGRHELTHQGSAPSQPSQQ
jgi:hypothetical protein